MLRAAIARNRQRHAKYTKAEKLLRRIRQHILDYEDQGAHKLAQAQRIMARCRTILAPLWEAQYKNRQAAKLQSTASIFESRWCG